MKIRVLGGEVHTSHQFFESWIRPEGQVVGVSHQHAHGGVVLGESTLKPIKSFGILTQAQIGKRNVGRLNWGLLRDFQQAPDCQVRSFPLSGSSVNVGNNCLPNRLDFFKLLSLVHFSESFRFHPSLQKRQRQT